MLLPPTSSVTRLSYRSDDIHEEPELYEPSEYTVPETPNLNARSHTDDSYDHIDWAIAGPNDLCRQPTNLIRRIADFDQPTHLELHEEEEDPFDDDERRFINPALLSHLAVQLRDSVPRGTHVKGSIPYPRAFTGKDIVVCHYRGSLPVDAL